MGKYQGYQDQAEMDTGRPGTGNWCQPINGTTTLADKSGKDTVDVNGEKTAFAIRPHAPVKTPTNSNWRLSDIIVFTITASVSTVIFNSRSRLIPKVPKTVQH